MNVEAGVCLVLVSGLLMAVTGEQVSASAGENEKSAISKVVHDSIRWALTKDRALQESTMAQDDELFVCWTSSDSSVSGWSRYVKLFDTWMDPRFKATVTEVRDLNIHISKSGDVAWFSALLDDLGEWDGKPTGARNIRWTGVLEKREGRWLFVQMHGSLATDTAAKDMARPGD